MKTTLHLPEDVALTLRLESAKRGGRRVASYSKLVSDAVRQVYAGERAEPCSVDWKTGRVVVSAPKGSGAITSKDIATALDEDSRKLLSD